MQMSCPPPHEKLAQGQSPWRDLWLKLKQDRLTMMALWVVGFYSLLWLLSVSGLIASDWEQEVGSAYGEPSLESWRTFFGTDIFGRSVLLKVVKGTEVAMSVGLVVAMISTFLGTLLGATAGHFGGKVDEAIVWFYTTVSSIPNIMLLIAMTFILGKGIFAVYLALGLTYWTNSCLLVRGEVMKHKDREYVHAAQAIGRGEWARLFLHILPNITHIVIIQFSLMFQTAIKSEVILSYLGLGVQDVPSWGRMIDDAKVELSRGVWWQLAAATFAMFAIVLAFNLVSDGLRDALDPKLKGK